MGGARIEEHVRTDFAALPEALRARLGELSSPNTTLVLAETSGEPNSESLQQLVRELRAVSAPGREIHVGGEIAVFMDFVNAVYGHFPWAVALVLGVMYVVLLFLFASLVLPLKAVIMNALSITAAYGALVFVFQEGHLSELLRFQPQGFVEATIPVLMFFALFGLSMDYEVFLLSPNSGIVAADRRQHGKCGRRAAAYGRHHHRRGRHRDRGCRRVQHGRACHPQGARSRHGAGGACGCVYRARAARAVHHAAFGPSELVGAGLAGPPDPRDCQLLRLAATHGWSHRLTFRFLLGRNRPSQGGRELFFDCVHRAPGLHGRLVNERLRARTSCNSVLFEVVVHALPLLLIGLQRFVNDRAGNGRGRRQVGSVASCQH